MSGPLDPEGTAQLLMNFALAAAAGNQDRELIDGTVAAPGSLLESNKKTLSEWHGRWLEIPPLWRELPDDVLLFHGTPERDDVYLLESVRSGGAVAVLASMEEITERLGGVTQTLLLCGHTHIPRTVALPKHLMVNPGSVGFCRRMSGTRRCHTLWRQAVHMRAARLSSGVKRAGMWNTSRSGMTPKQRRRQYILTFEPKGGEPGAFHTIQATVKNRPELQVKTRAGYWAVR